MGCHSGFRDDSRFIQRATTSELGRAFTHGGILVLAHSAILPVRPQCSGGQCIRTYSAAPKLTLDSAFYFLQRTVGADYFKALYTANKAQVDALVVLAESGTATLRQLKAAYALARPLYEQIETLAPAFPEEDAAIDARPDGYEGGEHAYLSSRASSCVVISPSSFTRQLS